MSSVWANQFQYWQDQSKLTDRWSRFETYRLIALVAALVPQGLLISPDKVAMPGEEEPVTMYVHGFIYVDSDEVIVPSPRCWSPDRIRVGGFCLKTSYSFDVSLSF